MRRFVVWMFPVGMMILGAEVVSGQDYPNKPIRVVASEAGGAGDFAARLIAQGLARSLGQQVVIENRGGSGVIPAEVVAKSAPDGYTLLFFASTLWLLPFMQDNLPYGPLWDFSPITLAIRSPNLIVVQPSVAANSVKELIALAKARPGELNYGSGLPGYESASIFGMFAPAKTPATLINRLSQEIVRVLNSADVKEKFFNVGVETVGSSPEEFAATVKSEMAKLGKVIKEAGIRVE